MIQNYNHIRFISWNIAGWFLKLMVNSFIGYIKQFHIVYFKKNIEKRNSHARAFLPIFTLPLELRVKEEAKVEWYFVYEKV